MKALELKYQVCDWAKRAYQDGLFEGTCGNLSAFDRAQGIVVITPSGVAYDRYRPEDMVVIDLEGRVLEGNYPPSSEWIMHTMVYRQKPEVNAVIHTHSPYASAFAVRNEGIPAILIEMIPTLGGDVPLAQFGMPGTEEVGAEAVKGWMPAGQSRRACGGGHPGAGLRPGGLCGKRRHDLRHRPEQRHHRPPGGGALPGGAGPLRRDHLTEEKGGGAYE